jgi:hypothetical protein
MDERGDRPRPLGFGADKEQTGRPIGEVLDGHQLRHEAQVDPIGDAD